MPIARHARREIAVGRHRLAGRQGVDHIGAAIVTLRIGLEHPAGRAAVGQAVAGDECLVGAHDLEARTHAVGVEIAFDDAALLLLKAPEVQRVDFALQREDRFAAGVGQAPGQGHQAVTGALVVFLVGLEDRRRLRGHLQFVQGDELLPAALGIDAGPRMVIVIDAAAFDARRQHPRALGLSGALDMTVEGEAFAVPTHLEHPLARPRAT